MEKPPNTDILGWYVNKLYKKALDHCLQQPTVVPRQDQVSRDHGQGDSDNYGRRPICNSTLNGDLQSTFTKAINKDDIYHCRKNQGQKSNFQNPVSRSMLELKPSKLHIEDQNKLSTSQEMCHKHQQSSRTLHMNTILSERRYTINNKSVPGVRESVVSGDYNTGRQHMNETENYYQEKSKLVQETLSNLKSSNSFYRQRESYSQHNPPCSTDRYDKSKVSQVVTHVHEPNSLGQRIQCPVDVRNRYEMQKTNIQTLKPNRTDWFRHSAVPQQTNTQVPVRWSPINKNDSVLHRPSSTGQSALNMVPSVDTERKSNNWISYQHTDSVNEGKFSSQSSCSHQHPAKISSKGSESTCSHQHSDISHPGFFSTDRPVTKVSTDVKKPQAFKSSIFLSLKSNHHSSGQDLLSNQLTPCNMNSTEQCENRAEQKNLEEIKHIGHSVQLQSPPSELHPSSNILEPCGLLKPAKKYSSHSPKAVIDLTNTGDTSTEYLQSLVKEGTEIPLETNEDANLRTASGTLSTSMTSAALEPPVDSLPTSSHKTPSASEVREEIPVVSVPDSAPIVPLTSESLKLHNNVLSDSSLSPDKSGDSDGGESCKSGIVIKPGHSNQKRKRSLSLDKTGNKRKFSETKKNRINNPAKTKMAAKGNKDLTNTSGKTKQKKKTDKKKKEKHGPTSQYGLRNCRKKSANVVKTDKTKTTVQKQKKKDKKAVKKVDKSNKTSPTVMSDHLKHCKGREESILKAHEDQALAMDSDSVAHSLDAKRMSSMAFLDLKDLTLVPEPDKSIENQSVYMSKRHVGGVWNSIVKKI